MSFWLDRLAPDLGATLRRFSFAVFLAALATILFVALVNEAFEPDSETWARLMIGLATAAAFVVGGQFFVESRPDDRTAGLLLTYGLPVVVILLFQVRDLTWFVPYTLPVIGVMWVSVSAFTQNWRGDARNDAQDRFWWLNHRAIVSAVIAGVAFAVIAIGIYAIERSLALLFGLELDTILYNYILPVAGLFFAPVYWLSTLPRLEEYNSNELTEPDFLSRAIGFLGQFLLAPLLGAYALILLAYGVQILVTWSLPQGVLGWMVLAFVITGAATWLVLHPPFMRERLAVHWFRRIWFWATLIPLALYALAVAIRIDAYGVTSEREILVVGGIWALLLSGIYFTGRGDIRFIPGLAGLVLLIASVGPWNLAQGPVWSQSARLDAAIASAIAESGAPDWSTEQAAIARGALQYLLIAEGNPDIPAIFARHGVEVEQDAGFPVLIAALGIPDESGIDRPYSVRISRDASVPVLVRQTPYAYGQVLIWTGTPTVSPGFGFELTADEALEISRDGEVLATVSLGEWIDAQNPPEITAPTLDFAVEGRAYRLVVDEADLRGTAGASGDSRQIVYMAGTLFSAAAP